MAHLEANGITIEYEDFGPVDGRPLILIMGLGSQLTRWPLVFCEHLVSAGHRVIRFDNRDVGLSSHLQDAGVPDMGAIMAAMLEGKAAPVPYTLDDMAADTAALMEGLELSAAHICGASLGGMIAQTLAINEPQRVLSLTSIMSTTGNRDLPPATPEAMAALMSPAATDREGAARRTAEIAAVIGSPAYPADPAELKERALADFDRATNPAGVARQMAAAATQPDRRAALAELRLPSLIIHGKDDPLVPVAGGIDTHEAIPGSELLVIEGMGHDLPRGLWPQISQAIARLTQGV
ncbi:MAG: alpha/beta fold hydrolase [Pseudomonadota bacterium]